MMYCLSINAQQLNCHDTRYIYVHGFVSIPQRVDYNDVMEGLRVHILRALRTAAKPFQSSMSSSGFSARYFAYNAIPTGSSRISTLTPFSRNICSFPDAFVTSPTTTRSKWRIYINVAQMSQGLSVVKIVYC